MSEGFEGTFPTGPWTVSDGNGATGGDVYWGKDDFKPHAGSYSAWAARGGADGVDPALGYPADTDSRMTYGPFSLAGYKTAYLEFWYWNVSEPGFDLFSWSGSDDGTDYSGSATSGTSPGWVHQTYDLAPFVGYENVWVRFQLNSDSTNSDAGPFVDDIAIWGESLAPYAFGKTAPENAAVGVPQAPVLSWASSDTADFYEVCYDTSGNATCDTAWVNTGSSTSYQPSLPDLDTTWHWQVRATNDFGTTYADEGAWWLFRTVNQALFHSQADYDGWVLERDETSDKGDTLNAAGTTARLGDDALDRQYRAILDFDTEGLPDNAVVTGVTLWIRRESVTGWNPILTHGKLQVDIITGYWHGLEALEKYDFQAVGGRGNVGKFIKVMDPGDWYRAPLRAPAFTRIDLVGQTQFRLRFEIDDNDNGRANYLSFYTGNATDADNRPELLITYYVP